MSNTRDGKTLHRIVRTFEELSKGIQDLGVPKPESDRQAMRVALVLESWDDHEAMEYADRMFSS